MSLKLHCDGPDCSAELHLSGETLSAAIAPNRRKVDLSEAISLAMMEAGWAAIWTPPAPQRDLCPDCTDKWFQSTGGIV